MCIRDRPEARLEPDWRASLACRGDGPEEHGSCRMLGPADELPGADRVLVGVPGVLEANPAIILGVVHWVDHKFLFIGKKKIFRQRL